MNKSSNIADTNQTFAFHTSSEELHNPWSLLGVTDHEIDDALNGDDDGHSLDLHEDDDKSLNDAFTFPETTKNKDSGYLQKQALSSMGRFEAFRRRSSLVMTRRRSSLAMTRRRSSILMKRKSISFAAEDDYEPSGPSTFHSSQENNSYTGGRLPQVQYSGDHRSSSSSNLVLPDVVELQMQYQRSLQRFSSSMNRSDQTRFIVQRQCRLFIQNHPSLIQGCTMMSTENNDDDVHSIDLNNEGEECSSNAPVHTHHAPPTLQLFSPHRQVEREQTKQMIHRLLGQVHHMDEFLFEGTSDPLDRATTRLHPELHQHLEVSSSSNSLYDE
jgi:hypothetical protein